MTEKRESSARKLRILVIAYEYPPSPSPQSLRWAYLSGRLAMLGHEVHVMAPDISGTFTGLPDQRPDVQVHRVYPGPVQALLGWLVSRRPLLPATEPAAQSIASVEAATALAPSRLNWKGRLVGRFQQVVSWLIFPDLRGEWLRPALHALPVLLDQISPDVVVSSHEPATTLQVGLTAKASGYPWVADLGDPVLAGYTPPRWQRRAKKLEEATLRQADQVLVTTLETAERLRTRHRAGAPVTVLEQGFDERIPAQPYQADAKAPMDLLYSGSFYSFRDPAALVKAVLSVPGIRLSIASANLPDWLLAEAIAYPDHLRLLGYVPHRQLLDLQRKTDVLVNLANQDPAQVPGKFYEYLGAGRPILHVRAAGQDAASILLGKLRRGWSIPGTGECIVCTLADLRLKHEAGGLHTGLDMSADIVGPWSWSAAAARLQAMLNEAVSRSTR